MIMVTFKNVTKRFPNKTIFKDVNFSIGGCGVYLICGNSGVGKTTLLNMIASITPYEGIIENEYKDSMSYIFQNDFLIEHLNIKEQLDFFGISSSYLEKYNLKNKEDARISSLSKGEKARVALIVGLYRKNNLVLIDEPTTNLDKENKKIVIKEILKVGKDKLIILVNHEWKDIIDKVDGIIQIENKSIDVKIINKKTSTTGTIIKEKRKTGFKYMIKEWKYYLKDNIKIIMSFVCMSLAIFSLCFINNLFIKTIKDDINYSLDYNKFYLRECKEVTNTGIVVENCSNPSAEKLSLLKEENIEYGFNYDYLLMALFKRDDLMTVENKNVQLKKGRYPKKINEVITSDKYSVGETINITGSFVIEDKKIDIYHKDIELFVVGNYHDLNFISEDNIYLDYDLTRDYFSREILINNNYSVSEYFENAAIDSYKYVSFSNHKTDIVDMLGIKYDYYLILFNLKEIVTSIFKGIVIFLFIFGIYLGIKFNKNIQIGKQKSNAFLLANSYKGYKSVFASNVINLIVIGLSSLIFMFLPLSLGYLSFLFGVLYIIILSIQTFLYYRKSNVSNLMRENI